LPLPLENRSATPKPTLDADTILKRAAPVTGQHAHEIQPFGVAMLSHPAEVAKVIEEAAANAHRQ
jgi:hypothetical protein